MTAAELDIIIGANTDQAIAAFKKLGYQIKQTEQATTKFTQKSGKDFTGLSRVIQDLPFGFQGIQNNITELVPAAGGLGLAISAITAAITFATVGFGAWTRGMGESKEQVDELSKSLAGAQTELQVVSSLISVAKDLTQSTETRNNALNEAIRLQPEFLKGLNLENINSQEATNATNKLTDVLIRKAKVQAITNLLTKANEELNKQSNSTLKEHLLSWEAINRLWASTALTAGGEILRGAAEDWTQHLEEAGNEVKRLEGLLRDLTQSQALSGDFKLINPTKVKKEVKKAEKVLREGFKTFDPNIVLGSFEGVHVFDQATIDSIKAGLNKGIVGTDGALTIEPAVKVKPNLDLNYLEARAEDMAKIISQTVTDAFVAVGEGIGNFITGQGSLFSGIFEVIGSGLQNLGKYIIVTSTLIAKVQAALKAAFIGNPLLGIGIGVAMVALGTVLKNIPKFATGATVTKPTLAIIGESGPETVQPLGYQARANNVMNGEVVFTIQGQTLRGVLRRADNVAFNTF